MERLHTARRTDSLVGFGMAIRGPEFSTGQRWMADLALARDLGIRVTMHAGSPASTSGHPPPG